MSRIKQAMDVEKLLHWAFRDELSKRHTSSAEGIWDRLRENGQRGGIDPGHGAAQRYSHFGLPDPDAERIELAIAGLEDVVVDWGQSLPSVAGELSGLVSVNDMSRRSSSERVTVSSWGSKNGRRVQAENRPRDMIMVGALRPKALVTMHAIQGTRPDWHEEMPRPHMVQALKGPNAMIVGECRGRNLYTTGSYCPLQYEPSPVAVVTSRAEYAAWWEALNQLANRLELESYIALPPKAPPAPWQDELEENGAVIRVAPTGSMATVPLAPERPRALAPFRAPKAGPVRQIAVTAEAS